MSIEKKKNISVIRPKYSINEGKIYDCLLLNEELGAFKSQYYMADIMANTAMDMIRNHIKEKEVNFPSPYSKWRQFKIEIEYSEDSSMVFYNTTATFEGCNDIKVVVSLKISRNDVLSLSIFELKHKLTKIIAHELNHGYTVISTYNNKGEIPNYPTYYHQMVSIIQDDSINPNSIIYQIAYAVYVTSYLEVPAFVSQTVPQIAASLKNKNCSYEEFINEIKQTEAYEIYSDILYNLLPKVEKCDKKIIVTELNNYELKMNERILDKLIVQIKQNAEKAIRNIIRNAMIYFHEHIHSKKTDWFQLK